jgi:hypothetical protein
MAAAIMAMSSVRIPIVVDRAAHPGQRGRASALQSRVAPPACACPAAGIDVAAIAAAVRRLAAGEAGPDAPLQASPAGRGDGL